MLFSGLACFSPTVPSYIRKSWVMNGGTLTHNADDFRKANFFFCDGMEDPWLNELLSRSLIVRHAAWVTLCVLEDFLMPVADYTLDDGFDESKIRVSRTTLPGTTSSALVLPTRTGTIAASADDNAPSVQPTNPRKRRHDDTKNEGGDDQQEDEDDASENGRPRKKARRDLVAATEGTAPSRDVLRPVPTTPPPAQAPPPPSQQQQQQRRRRELPFAFSTVRGAQAILAGDAAGRLGARASEDQERQTAEKGNGIAGIGGVAGSGNRRTPAVHVQSVASGININIGVGASEIPFKPKGNGISVPKSRGRPNLKINKAVLFEKLIVRSENGVGPALRSAQVFPRPRPSFYPAAAASSLASTAPPNADVEGGKRPFTTKIAINTLTLFWNDILAKCLIQASNAKDAAAPCVKLSVGDLLRAPRTKAVIFDVNKTYRGRRFVSLDNDYERRKGEAEEAGGRD